MALPYKELRPSQVILDPENPRLPDGTSSDREAINRLLDEGSDALISLARDMAKTGKANPSELPIALRQGNRYLIVEGNRRFAALKLLADPALADDEAHQNAFRRAAALGQAPKAIAAYVTESKEEADYWIVLRHTGENGGRGVRSWSAAQTAVHRRRMNKSVDSGTLRSMAIADDVEAAYASDAEIVDLVRKVRRDKLTNIGRFFSLDVMAMLYFKLEADQDGSPNAKTLWVRHGRDQLRDFFAWAFAFILDNSVDAYKNAEIRAKALHKVSHLLPSPQDADEEPSRLAYSSNVETDLDDDAENRAEVDDGADEAKVDEAGFSTNAANAAAQDPNSSTTQTAEASNSTRPEPARRKQEARPERYMFQGLKLPRHNARVQRLLKECRQLVIEESPGIVCVMTRVLVEMSVSSAEALSLSGATENDSFKAKVVAMLRYLDPDIEHPRKADRDLVHAYLEISGQGPQYLNGFVHNPSMIPDPHLARRFINAFRPFLTRVDGAL